MGSIRVYPKLEVVSNLSRPKARLGHEAAAQWMKSREPMGGSCGIVKHARRERVYEYIASPFNETATKGRSKALNATLAAKTAERLQELREKLS